ncbi:MAG TPA: glycogen debranching N-terminal domain-containing protein [Longimicrobiales bacterium]
MAVMINEGTTFLISDDLGDVPEEGAFGLFSEDTRFLCLYRLLLDGQPPVLLSTQSVDYFAAKHFLTNPMLTRVPASTIGLVRSRIVGRGMREEVRLTNYGDCEARFTLELRFAADFASIFDVKAQAMSGLAASRHAGALAPAVCDGGRTQRFSMNRGELERELLVTLPPADESGPGWCRFRMRLTAGTHRTLAIEFDPASYAAEMRGRMRDRGLGLMPRGDRDREHAHMMGMVGEAPALHTRSFTLRRAYDRSVEDFAALRVRGAAIAGGAPIIAAGVPWYMALFGRDSLIAAYQTLAFMPELAHGTLRALAELQGTEVDRDRAEEPGKILHEHRFGPLAGMQRPIAHFPYYGTVDATPLFLMMLTAVCRLEGDVGLARELLDHAWRAVEWMERYGDLDGDGYLEYGCGGESGLANQGWKDSGDSVRFRDGSLARPPIALCEVQGYAYAARCSMADILDALGERGEARRLRADASRLGRRFNRDFWIPERAYYAEALDGDKRRVDSLTSNAGHLLWTGIAEPAKARQSADRLLDQDLFSGWGIRTMGRGEGGYSPISYHNGSIWPHDNGLIVAGLARYGLIEHASRIAAGLLEALSHSPDHRLPELFAGFGKDEAHAPVQYPSACRPQAWASGTVFLLLTAMAGLDFMDEDPLRRRPFLPRGVDGFRLDGLRIGGRRVRIEVARSGSGAVSRRIEPASG